MRLLFGILIVLIYISLSSAEGNKTFKANLRNIATCKEIFDAPSFIITLPERLDGSSIDCKFVVKLYAQDVCHLRINFVEFMIPPSSSCQEQYLRVGNRKVCGNIIGTQVFPIEENNNVIHYRGDSRFPLEIEVFQERCGTKIRSCDILSSADYTEITSVNYPLPYPTPLLCRYTIQTASQQTCLLTIQFLDFHIPESVDCLKGRLLIDGEPYCGHKTGLIIYKNITNSLTFDFSEGSGQSFGGFRLAVERSKCNGGKGNFSADQLSYYPPERLPFPLCCNKPFSAPFFVLTNPGFIEPKASLQEINCVYRIIKASPRVCRLRFNFIHFWLGQEDVYYGCVNGFLDIDGQRICGCKDGITYFSYFVDTVKELKFTTQAQSMYGFVIEVQQEECALNNGRSFPEIVTSNPKKEVEVFRTNSTTDRVKSRFLIPGQNSQCAQLQLNSWHEKIKTFSGAVQGSCELPRFPQNPINPSFPFFHYVPSTSSLQPNFPAPTYPIVPSQSIPSTKRFWHTSLPPIYHFHKFPPPILVPKCQIFHSLQGTIRSPRFPFPYPPNLKCCYRIRQAPGYCELQLIVLTFDVDRSPLCDRDFLLLDGRARYCGRSLQFSDSILTFRNNYASIDFVTDNNIFSSQGFEAEFIQKPCSPVYFQRSDKPDTKAQPQPNPSSDYPKVADKSPEDEFSIDVPAEK